MIRVVLAEDHTLVREGIRTLLSLVPDIALVGEAADGEHTVRLVEQLRPNVLLLDMRMPHADGLEVVTRLAARGRLPATLVLTTFDDDDAAAALIAAGARGFLLKNVTLERLVAAVRTLAVGGSAVPPALAERAARVVAARAAGLAAPAPPAPASVELSPREREVLKLLVAGHSNREIGRALFVAEGTVKNHISNILHKLGVRDRTQAVIKALEHGLG